MKALSLQLELYQQTTLEDMRDRHPTPYLREKAAALLKIAAGAKVEDVARAGLLKPRKADTVRGWLKAYQRYGLGGLYQHPRRGGSFPPWLRSRRCTIFCTRRPVSLGNCTVAGP